MSVRKNILPKAATDKGAFAFVSIMIPLTYWFELFVVMPTMYPQESLWRIVHFLCGTFLMVNITSNFMAIIVTDTSIRGKMFVAKSKWSFCSVCESVSPPRSYHCNVCNICILKREHHCIFTGCCVGHYNHRYFCMFLLYMFIATVYASYFNFYFVWENFKFSGFLSVLNLIFPLAMFAFGFDSSEYQLHLVISVITFAGIFFTGALLYYHLNLLKCGAVTYEKNHRIRDYDLGLKQNIKEVLGEKWFMTWISPFIKSPLPHDGMSWDTKQSWKNEGPKHR